MVDFVNELQYYINNKEEHIFKIKYSDFEYMYKTISIFNGKKGIIMISENIAVLCLDDFDYIKFYLISNDKLRIENFNFLYGIEVIGSSKNEKSSFFDLIVNDFKRMYPILIVISLIYFFIFLSSGSDMDKLGSVVEVLVTICSIFFATIFVFIGMFYGNKERSIVLYKKGLCDKEYGIDKYVIKLSFISLLLLMISYSICKVNRIYFNKSFLNVLLLKINFISEYKICVILTYVSIIFIVICFDSLINYYLRTCRNEFFVDAVNEKMKERKH